MANEYYPNCFDPTQPVQDDMQKVETNFAALNSVFSSTGGPGSPVAYQLWAKSTTSGEDAHNIKVRNHANTVWYSMFNAYNGQIVIADSIRKPSIIDGEAINPASCTIQCGGGGGVGGSVNFPVDYIGGESYPMSMGSKFPETYYDYTGLETLIYIPDGTSARGRLHIATPLGSYVSVRFRIGGAYSTASGNFTTAGGVWSPEVSFGPMAGTGWATLYWQIKWTIAVPSSISANGHNINQV